MNYKILGLGKAPDYFKIEKNGAIKLQKSLKEDESKLTTYIVSVVPLRTLNYSPLNTGNMAGKLALL